MIPSQISRRISHYLSSKSIHLFKNRYHSRTSVKRRTYQTQTHFQSNPSFNAKYLVYTGPILIFGGVFTYLRDPVEAQSEVNHPPIHYESRNLLFDQANHHLPSTLATSLKQILGDRFVTNHDALDAHSRDFSYHTPSLPSAVLYPISPEEVSQILRLCNISGVGVIPYGSGTSLEGHIIPECSQSVTLNMSKMNNILSFNKEDMDVTVQPGITYAELNNFLLPHGFFLPLEPGPGASIGGMLATSCSGPYAVRYGTAKDQVLSLEVILADGKHVKTGTRSRKSSAGYDLTHLFVGSEGTLGVIVSATLKLQRIPEKSTVGSVTFDSLKDASDAVIELMQEGIRVAKCELLDTVCIQSVNITAQLGLQEKDTLLFEFSGSAAEVEYQIERTMSIVKKRSKYPMIVATNEEERADLWRARKEALFSAKSLQDGASVAITDACVPLSRLSEVMEETQEDVRKSGLIAPIVAHAGDGNFHLFVLFDQGDPEKVKAVHDLSSRLAKRAIDMEGTCTGEHGIGIGKRDFLEYQLGTDAVLVMQQIKSSLDPNNILNPQKIIPEKHQNHYQKRKSYFHFDGADKHGEYFKL